MTESKTTHITPAGGNIFLDLGFDPEEARRLKAHSDMLIQTKLALTQSVGQWIKENQLKQDEAAEILQISRPRVSDAVNQKISKFTVDALLEMLARTGKEVQLTIK